MSTIRERLSAKAVRYRIPIMSAFELLPVCNLQCKMCYVRKSMSEVKALGGLKDVAWWLNLAKEASECGMLYPLLTGGEPFLYPGFFELLHGLHGMGMQVSINSNATLIDRETARKLSECPPTRINVTLYGATAESYERLCGDGGAYQRMKDAVGYLKEFQIPVKFNASITPDNVQDIEKMIAFAKEMECPIQVVTYMFPPIRRDKEMIGKNERLSPKEAAHARVYAEFLQNDSEWFLSQASRYERFVPLEQCFAMGDGKAALSMSCKAGVSSFWIDWQGNMTNCGMYGSTAVSLKENGFKKAWEELVEKNKDVNYVTECAKCKNRLLCHPCIAMVNNECGSSGGRPEYICLMNQALSQYYKEYAKKIAE